MFLQSLVSKKMETERLSLRRASHQIGISHTTLFTFLNGHRVDMPTTEAICKWVNVSVRDALGYDVEGDVNSVIAAIVNASPELGQIFKEAAADMASGKISETDLHEIVQYTAYRLKVAHERSTAA